MYVYVVTNTGAYNYNFMQQTNHELETHNTHMYIIIYITRNVYDLQYSHYI